MYVIRTFGTRLDGKKGVTGIVGGLEAIHVLSHIHHAKSLHDSIEIRVSPTPTAPFDQCSHISLDEAIRIGREAALTDPFIRAYLDCALWSSTDESREDGGDPLDDNYTVDDIADETMAEIVADCLSFITDHRSMIFGSLESPDYGKYRRAGHDFWLTRNGHGAGFWDGNWPEAVGNHLTKCSHAAGSYYLYVGDDGKIHGQ